MRFGTIHNFQLFEANKSNRLDAAFGLLLIRLNSPLHTKADALKLFDAITRANYRIVKKPQRTKILSTLFKDFEQLGVSATIGKLTKAAGLDNTSEIQEKNISTMAKFLLESYSRTRKRHIARLQEKSDTVMSEGYA